LFGTLFAASFTQRGRFALKKVRSKTSFKGHRSASDLKIGQRNERRSIMGKEKLKILLVDDEKEFVESLSERLELRNLETDVAYDGEEALEALKQGKHDVMVLDLRMPGIDGIEVLRRAKKRNPDVQVVVLTGHGTEEDEEQAKKLGAFAYLKKPVNIDHLIGALKKEKMKVLLVDDEKEFVESLSERLELRNLEADVAYDGEEALEALKQGKHDVMVLDLRMPGIDGIEVLRRAKKRNPDVQIVVLTGHGTEKDEEQAKKLGAFAYLKKPVDIDHLVGTLNKVWGRLKKSKNAVDSVIMAAAFAQAGEREMARETLEEFMKKDKGEKQGGEPG
jgi:CheY-like chemotaxis protein